MRVGSSSFKHRVDESFIIGIAGGTASGKTTVCRKIINRLNEACVALIHQDRYANTSHCCCAQRRHAALSQLLLCRSFYRALTEEERQDVKCALGMFSKLHWASGTGSCSPFGRTTHMLQAAPKVSGCNAPVLHVSGSYCFIPIIGYEAADTMFLLMHAPFPKWPYCCPICSGTP